MPTINFIGKKSFYIYNQNTFGSSRDAKINQKQTKTMQLIYSVITPILFTLCSCASTKAAGNCDKCSGHIAVMAINKNDINEQIIEELFCTAEDSCQVNAEFMEVFNKALFACLEKSPEIFVKQFSIISNQGFILKQ
jgi:hypothetical protein